MNSRDRFANQRVVLRNNTVLKGKNVRVVSPDRFIDLGGNTDLPYIASKSTVLGDVRVNGRELPVYRLRGRVGWRQAGFGKKYKAD